MNATLNTIATTATTATATVWTTKAGTSKSRLSATGALSAPVATRISVANATDLTRWQNGNCAAIVADIRAILSDKQALQVAMAATLNPTGKADSMAFLHAAIAALSVNSKGEMVTPKGEKSRFINLMGAILTHESERETARAMAQLAILNEPTTELDVAPTLDVAPY